MGRSQLYSGDVLAPEALEDLTGWMAQAAPGDKRQMMALLRELHATISPTGSAPWLHAHPLPLPPLSSYYVSDASRHTFCLCCVQPCQSKAAAYVHQLRRDGWWVLLSAGYWVSASLQVRIL